MRIKVLFLIIISFAALTLGKFSMAHHGFAAYSNERITVQAVITELRFINPHVQLYFTIEGDAGQSESWQYRYLGDSRHNAERKTAQAFAFRTALFTECLF